MKTILIQYNDHDEIVAYVKDMLIKRFKKNDISGSELFFLSKFNIKLSLIIRGVSKSFIELGRKGLNSTTVFSTNWSQLYRWGRPGKLLEKVDRPRDINPSYLWDLAVGLAFNQFRWARKEHNAGCSSAIDNEIS